jgi:predicted DNA-binding helix-hairpin-helix protein
MGIMNENVLAKLKILAESAKYDVSCSSSGTVRSNKPGTLGNTVGGWGFATALPRRAVYLAIENHAYQLLYLRLCLLYQPA